MTSRQAFLDCRPHPATRLFWPLLACMCCLGWLLSQFALGRCSASKGPGRHVNWGLAYVWSLGGVVVATSVLSVMHWPQNVDLSVLGGCAMLAAWGGHAAVQRRWPHWPRLHLAGIGVYYTFFLMTAVYVDNGRFLPLWHALPGLAFWLIPRSTWGAADCRQANTPPCHA